MPNNEYLPFCQTDTGTNLETQAEYLADAQRTAGNQSGLARSKLVNKAIRQATAVMNVLASIVMDRVAADVLDNGNLTTLKAQFAAAFPVTIPVAPSQQLFTSGSGSYGLGRAFFVTAASATVGATYTNNTVTFTVLQSITAGTLLYAAGAGTPTASGTLTKASGTGDATITFSAFKTPLYLEVEMVGPGGGGAGSGSTVSGGSTDASNGGNSTAFGTALLACNGGLGGKGSSNSGIGGLGGTSSIAAPAVGLTVQGGPGAATGGYAVNAPGGGNGGSTGLGAGGGGGCNTAAQAAPANTGGGGGGGGYSQNTGCGGGGGGGGGYLRATIYNPSSSYTYVIDTPGAPSAAGTNGFVGTIGSGGRITVREFYQ